MGLLKRVKNWINGEDVTHTDINAEFDNIVDNFDPDGLEDASADATAMNATADPYPSSIASLATDLRGEIQRIRYLIKQITSSTQWYIFPDLVTKTAAYTATLADNVILANGNTGAFTVTLPAASGNEDKVYTIVNIGTSNSITVDGDGSEQIQGATTITLTNQYDYVSIVCIGTAWLITSSSPLPERWPSFSVYKGSGQTITTATTTKVTWDTEDFDVGSMFASDKFSPTVKGKYLLTAGIGWAGLLADGSVQNIEIYKNGASAHRIDMSSGGAVSQSSFVSAVVDNDGNDYFEVYITHNHGSDRNITATQAMTFFTGCRIG